MESAASEIAGTRPAKARESLEASVLRILRAGLEWQRFPTFCAVLVGGSTLLQVGASYPCDITHFYGRHMCGHRS
jgi:hypothetical protein